MHDFTYEVQKNLLHVQQAHRDTRIPSSVFKEDTSSSEGMKRLGLGDEYGGDLSGSSEKLTLSRTAYPRK